MNPRYAIYYTPPHEAALTKAANAWIGRDAFTNAIVPRPPNPSLSAAEIAFHTAAPRRYGFHATLKAPFRLAEGESESSLIAALEAFAATVAPVVLPRVAIGQLDDFLALVPETRSLELNRLADQVVTTFDRFRAPMRHAEVVRRNPASLTPAGLRNLLQWGYPHVFESFRFHMTLTGKLALSERQRVRDALTHHLASALPSPFVIASLALFVEPEPGAPFEVRSFHSLAPLLEMPPVGTDVRCRSGVAAARL